MSLFDSVFGFKLKKKKGSEKKKSSFVFPSNTDGAVLVDSTAGIGSWNAYVDLDGAIRDESQMISRYRDMTLQPEVNQAVNHIINDMVVQHPGEPAIEIILDKTDLSENVKEKVREQFNHICKLLDFNNQAYDIARRWFVDGRIYYHIEIDENQKSKGISNLVYIDPRQIKKIREIEVKRSEKESNVNMVEIVDEYYIYDQQGFFNTNNINSDQGMAGYGSGAGNNSFRDHHTYTVNRSMGMTAPTVDGAIKLSNDSVIFAHSNLVDAGCRFILSHLHSAIRFVNLLRMLEDAIIIYRISRAPERRVFYIDVDGLNPKKAQEHVREVMNSYRNQTTYDAVTGETREDKRHLSMLDDFWLPRRNVGGGTEVQNLSGGQSLGEIRDLEYFQDKLYESLQVPISRFRRADKGFSIGRSNEVTQDELQFSRYITRLRTRFSSLFDELLKKQLIITNTLSEEEWDDIKENIYYDFNTDSHFAELKESELMRNRFQLLRDIGEYEGNYVSRQWIQENVLHMSEEDVKNMKKQIKAEAKESKEHKLERAELVSQIKGIVDVDNLPNLHKIESDSSDDDLSREMRDLERDIDKIK
jgi:hypothetical protein